mgnify:CR=1 FL=1
MNVAGLPTLSLPCGELDGFGEDERLDDVARVENLLGSRLEIRGGDRQGDLSVFEARPSERGLDLASDPDVLVKAVAAYEHPSPRRLEPAPSGEQICVLHPAPCALESLNALGRRIERGPRGVERACRGPHDQIGPEVVLVERFQHADLQRAEGRMDERVPPSGADEIRQLGDAFNSMADRLVELQEDVRKQERQAMFGRIAAGLVHDLSHPIQNIGNSCKLIVKMFDDEEYRETFKRTVEREMVIIKRVLDDLRNIARPIPLAPPITTTDRPLEPRSPPVYAIRRTNAQT